jgi:hypothetical protein
MHDVMFMFIETKKHIKAFKEQGRSKILQSFEQHAFSDAWISYSKTYYN